MELANQVQNLIIGNIYSYSELCKVLRAEECSGNTRIAQRKVWDSYFTLEKIGRKFKVIEVFQNMNIDTMFKEQHTINSAKLLLDYFMEHKNTSKFTRIEQYPELIETLLFSSDIGEACGYLPESYRYTKVILGNKQRLAHHPVSIFLKENSIDNGSISIFTKTVKETFKDIRDTLLESLRKKKVIQHYRKVLIRVEELPKQAQMKKKTRNVALTDSEVAVYNTIVDEYCRSISTETSQRGVFNLTKHDWVKIGRLLEASLGFRDIYTGYYVAFLEKTVVSELEKLAKQDLAQHNNKHLKDKVINKLVKKVVKEVDKVGKVAEDFEKGIIDTGKSMEFSTAMFGKKEKVDKLTDNLDNLLEEFLTIAGEQYE